MNSIDLYIAVARMKEITKAGGTFSLKFRKYDRQRGRGGDLVCLKAVRLRKKPTDEQVQHADHKLFIVDTETGEARTCWQILVVEFEGMKTIL
ncbi:MAG: hypothetical protein Q4D56_12840 [Bacteroides sp.]|nr:hypothetical protein [Bacteroides sp.]